MSADAAQKPARGPLLFVLLTVLIDTIGFGIIAPVVPGMIIEIAQVTVDRAAQISGVLMLVFAALQFLCAPLMGNLSDAYGRRPVLLASLFAFGINYALVAFAPTLSWLFLGRAISGIAGAVYAPANAYVADVTAPEKRAQSFGLVGAAFGLGFVVGPALGGLLGEAGTRAPFFAASAMAFMNCIYGYFVLPESLPKERRRPFQLSRAHPLGMLRAFRESKTVLGLAVVALFWQIAFQVYPSTWAFYTMAKFDLTPSRIGATLALSGISMALVQSFVTGRVVAKLGEARTAPIGVAIGATSFLCYAFIDESWMLIPILVIGGLQGIAMPSINAMMSKSLGPTRQGELSGGMASIMGLAAIIGPVLMTQALSHFTAPDAKPFFPGAAFVLAACVALTSFVLLLGRLRHASASAAVTAQADEKSAQAE